MKEIIDSNTLITLKYELSDSIISERELEVLMDLLDNLHWEYEISKEGSIFIQLSAIRDMEGLSYLDGELTRKINQLSN